MVEPLTEFEKGQLDSVLRMGCPRTTAYQFAGVAAERFAAEIERDPAFAQKVLQAESHPEVRHMGNINKASQDEKNWRTSAWWLDRRARGQASVSDSSDWNVAEAVRDALEKLADVVAEEIPDADRRQAVIARLLAIADEAVRVAVEEPRGESMASAPTPLETAETEP